MSANSPPEMRRLRSAPPWALVSRHTSAKMNLSPRTHFTLYLMKKLLMSGFGLQTKEKKMERVKRREVEMER